MAAHPRAALAGVYDIHTPSATEVAEKLEVPQFEIRRGGAGFARSGCDPDSLVNRDPCRPDRGCGGRRQACALRKAD
ncbi:hypothetical protein [Paracoccus sp. (in: a-proteobacteria)]|uniref:hypothetical protein n=1 Tax=Paracoccus sp. TaxID=267 RepID=UPI002AFFB79F|nr:hypothetical protein [Paracoccus sp. (in: a-proteobacteria)]